jgi:hypothetical protein
VADDDDGLDELQRFRRRHVFDSDKGIAGTMRYGGLSARERDERIVALHRAGYSQTAIAAHLGLTQQGVSKALKRIKAGRAGRDRRG